MMLANDIVRVALATTHLPLRAVADAITPDGAANARCASCMRALRDDFGIAAPRIAVLGLNPHAGEAGHLGREEIDVIEPVLDALRAEGMHAGRPAARRHRVPAGEAARLRRGAGDVPRPGPAGAQVQRLRAGGEPHPRPALPARRGRPRHRAGPRRPAASPIRRACSPRSTPARGWRAQPAPRMTAHDPRTTPTASRAPPRSTSASTSCTSAAIIEQDRAGGGSAARRPPGRDRPRPGRDHLPAARPPRRADRRSSSTAT